jgi:hypothetical protein
MDFDETRLYFSHQQLQRKGLGDGVEGGDSHDATNLLHPDEEVDENAVDLKAVRRHFREFLST